MSDQEIKVVPLPFLTEIERCGFSIDCSEGVKITDKSTGVGYNLPSVEYAEIWFKGFIAGWDSKY